MAQEVTGTMQMRAVRRIPMGFAALTLTVTAAQLCQSVPTGATEVDVSIESGSARYRDDGTAPTTTIGQLLTAGTFTLALADLTAAQMVATASTVPVTLTYYRV